MRFDRRRLVCGFGLAMVAVVLCGTASWAQLHRPAVTPPPFNLPGATNVDVALPIDKAFDATVTFLKLNSYAVELTDKDGGQIATSFTGKKPRTRAEFVLIKTAAGQTTVRAAVITQVPDHSFTAPPDSWKAPVIDAAATAALVEKLKAALAKP